MVPKNCLLLLIIFSFTIAQKSLDEYFNDNSEQSTNDGGNNLEENDCICAVNPKECNYHCCCDDNCPNEAIEDWENHSKCINEQNTPKLSDDKCIDRNLFPSWYKISNEYPRRGLHLENQTEDIPKKSATINNLCFSIDNSKSKDIITLDDLEKYGYKSIDELYDDIFSLYIEPYFIKNNNDNSDSQSGTATTLRRTSTNDEKSTGIQITNDGGKNYFIKDGKFSLYSGTTCQNIDLVEKWSPKNYSCLMKDNFIKFTDFDNMKINEYKCDKERYHIDEEGLLKSGNGANNLNVIQVEFILKIDSIDSKIDYCKINIVEYNNNDKPFTFKNSVIFTHNQEIPYRYSGNIGYLNGYPLKIYAEYKDEKGNEIKEVYNDLYIVGKNKVGDCRTDNALLEYLYFSDKPFLFNEDYTYSCKLSSNTELQKTTLYQEIIAIQRIAKYGSSDYRNIDNEDWIAVNTDNVKSKKGESNKNFNIKMEIKYKTDKQKGFYSHKYINEVSFSADPVDCTSNCYVRLKIKYTGDEESNESKYNKVPDIPFFIPNIPDDILDPFINPDVDK